MWNVSTIACVGGTGFFRVKGETEDAQTQAFPRSVKLTKNLAGSCHAGYVIFYLMT